MAGCYFKRGKRSTITQQKILYNLAGGNEMVLDLPEKWNGFHMEILLNTGQQDKHGYKGAFTIRDTSHNDGLQYNLYLTSI